MQEINNKNQILIIWHSSLDLKIVTGPSKRTKIAKAPNFPKETLFIFFCNNVLHNTVYNASYTQKTRSFLLTWCEGRNRAARSHGFWEALSFRCFPDTILRSIQCGILTLQETWCNCTLEALRVHYVYISSGNRSVCYTCVLPCTVY